MEIKIPVKDEQNAFRKAITLLDSIPPYNRCTNKELEIFSQFCYYNFVYREEKDFDERMKKIFGEERKILKYTDTSKVYYKKILVGLRESGLVIAEPLPIPEGNVRQFYKYSLNPKYTINAKQVKEGITFKFTK